MKKASKIFVLISMIAVPIMFVVYLVFGLLIIKGANIAMSKPSLSDEKITTYQTLIQLIQFLIAFFAVVVAVSETVGGFALHKLKTANQKSDLTLIAVLTILFCSMVGGILMLCIPEEQLGV